jgi:hypothetical protein
VQPPATFRLNELSVKLLVERGDTDALRACADASSEETLTHCASALATAGKPPYG